MKDDFQFFWFVMSVVISLIFILIFVLFTIGITENNIFKSCESINHYYINDKRSIKCEVIQK
jgi:hypothetical protein